MLSNSSNDNAQETYKMWISFKSVNQRTNGLTYSKSVIYKNVSTGALIIYCCK